MPCACALGLSLPDRSKACCLHACDVRRATWASSRLQGAEFAVLAGKCLIWGGSPFGTALRADAPAHRAARRLTVRGSLWSARGPLYT